MPANWETDIDTVDANFLREAVLALGHRAELLGPADGAPLPTLHVQPADLPPGGARELTMTFYPLPADQFPDSRFLQYLAVLQEELDAAALDRLAAVLPEVNNRLVIGHFGLSRAAGQLHLRHVQRLPADEVPSEEHVGDVLTLFVLTPVMFGAMLVEVAAGRLDAAGARRQLEESAAVS